VQCRARDEPVPERSVLAEMAHQVGQVHEVADREMEMAVLE
jgi:hypothetical protein